MILCSEKKGTEDDSMYSDLSVVIPAYNIEPYLMECIASIERQSYACKEVVIVDDGSTDGTYGECVKASLLYENIKIYRQENLGVTVARRNGAKQATGKYVIFIDGDDYIEPLMFERMMEQAQEYEYVSCGVFRHYSEDRVEIVCDSFQGKITDLSQSVFRRMIYDFDQSRQQPMTPWMVNKIFRRSRAVEVLERIPAELAYAEDSAFLYQYILKCKNACFIKEPLYHYRYRPESAWHSKNENMLKNINLLYVHLKPIFEKEPTTYQLIPQLQKWMVLLIMNAVNKYMGFDRRFSIFQYRIDTSGLLGKRIVLYGAGQVGKSIRRQLEDENIPVVLWVDRDARHYHKEGWNVREPERIKEISYDQILVAVKEEHLFISIRNDLIKRMKIKNGILWRKPIALY